MNPKIPRFDFREQYRALKAEILQAVDRVLESGELILGPSVRAFEEKMCQFLSAEGHGVGVGSGTDALAIAMRALKIGAGDEVITVANTAVATVSAIRMVGAIPVFCDIDPQTLLMDAADAEKRITPRTRAILPVHLFGNAADMPVILKLARQRGLRVIEDCAQSCGTTLHGRATGTWGDIGCFSFYPTKNLAACGDGGLCFTRDPQLADSMRQIRTYGWDSNRQVRQEGVNSRLDEIQAAILEVKLRHFSRFQRQRNTIAAAYRENLPSQCVMQRTTVGAEHSHHLVVVQVARREQVMAELRSAGVECDIHYTPPLHRTAVYRRMYTLPATEYAARRILTLPCYPELPLDSVRRVCAVLSRSVEVAVPIEGD